jgi:LAO/AO transport system kinase
MIEPKKLAKAVRDGDRRAMAQAITLVESAHPEDRGPANELLSLIAPHAGRSIRIGISGVPGVGKSTFIESFGNHVIDAGHRVAVLAIDPSSALTGGSILGDKTRMETLSGRLEAFIRPSPTGQTLGGVTRHTRDTISIVEAAGFDVVVVETVGVGQSETTVAQMTDMFVLLLLPGGGDELQGIKRGIVELADLIVVNKADGDLESAAGRSAADYRGALGFMHPRHPDWKVPVMMCSALENKGIEEIWDVIRSYRETLTENGEFEKSRAAQAKAWLWNETAETLLDSLRHDPAVRDQIEGLETAVADGKTSPGVAAEMLVRRFLKLDNGNKR